MKNKVLIKLHVPELNISFDIFIPVNESIGKLKKLLIKAISGMTTCYLDEKRDYALLDKQTSKVYFNREIVFDTNIRNASELILISSVNISEKN